MTRSRKLVMATALVAGGYGLAVVATSISDFFWARSLLHSAGMHHATDAAGPVGTSPPESARLVPQRIATPAATDFSGSFAASDRVTVVEYLASAEADSQVTTAGAAFPVAAQPVPPARSPLPILKASAAPTEPKTKPDVEPRARLTAVKKQPGTSSTAAGPSPWDRWPRWDPPVAATSSPSTAHRGSLTRLNAGVVTAEPATFVPASVFRAEISSAAGPVTRRDDTLADLRVHVVIDGDSLDKLADRYLDDPTQGDAIFKLNQKVLTDRELLPIGAELVIPLQKTPSVVSASPPTR